MSLHYRTDHIDISFELKIHFQYYVNVIVNFINSKHQNYFANSYMCIIPSLRTLACDGKFFDPMVFV